jgi:hypothetical protein
MTDWDICMAQTWSIARCLTSSDEFRAKFRYAGNYRWEIFSDGAWCADKRVVELTKYIQTTVSGHVMQRCLYWQKLENADKFGKDMTVMRLLRIIEMLTNVGTVRDIIRDAREFFSTYDHPVQE